MPKYLCKYEAKAILKNKRLYLELTIYRERLEKIKENMSKVYGIVFVQCTPSLQSVLKRVPNNDKKSKDFYFCG